MPWRNPELPLGERCLLWCAAELAKPWQPIAPYPALNTNDRVREWLSKCRRNGKPLGLTAGNWCAAFQSAALLACALRPEETLHGFRAGVVELIEDVKSAGRYHPLEEVRSGSWSPNRGDLVIFDRSDPKRPETSWQRHVARFEWWTGTDWKDFTTLGGNEDRRIMRRVRSSSDPKLLGFISFWVEKG